MARIALKELESDKSQTVTDVEALIGRDPACGFVIEGPKSKVVSGRHARIFFQDGAWWIQDMSRNGTILDEERLQAGQRHALRVGQLIGLGESGPRLRVAALESRNVSETMLEPNDSGEPAKTTAPRQRPMLGGSPSGPGLSKGTTALPQADPSRPPPRIEEATEPMSPSPDWVVQVTLRTTHADVRFECKGSVVRIGRSPECDVRIAPEQGASVSRVHAEIAIADGGIVVRDAGSRNGTFLNGNRIQTPNPVTQGDQITLGAGGPTLQVDELHIVKGKRSDAPAPRSIGGGATPEAVAKQAPSPAAAAVPATAFVPNRSSPAPTATARPNEKQMATPPGGALFENVLEDVPAKSAQRLRIIVWVLVGALALAAAAFLGRMSAS